MDEENQPKAALKPVSHDKLSCFMFCKKKRIKKITFIYSRIKRTIVLNIFYKFNNPQSHLRPRPPLPGHQGLQPSSLVSSCSTRTSSPSCSQGFPSPLKHYLQCKKKSLGKIFLKIMQ